MEEDGFVLVSLGDECLTNVPQDDSHEILSGIDESIESLRAPLWSINKFIHENPELAFGEHKAHDVLTNFMRSRKGWLVTTSACGMETAWIAVYDSGKAGPVVSFNIEMGTPTSRKVKREEYC